VGRSIRRETRLMAHVLVDDYLARRASARARAVCPPLPVTWDGATVTGWLRESLDVRGTAERHRVAMVE
jgi:hypothetical protein